MSRYRKSLQWASIAVTMSLAYSKNTRGQTNKTWWNPTGDKYLTQQIALCLLNKTGTSLLHCLISLIHIAVSGTTLAIFESLKTQTQYRETAWLKKDCISYPGWTIMCPGLTIGHLSNLHGSSVKKPRHIYFYCNLDKREVEYLV